jgi:hypothetical protein
VNWTLPTADTTRGRFARELALLLGPAHGNAPASSNRLDDLMALGYALAYAWQRQRDALSEVHPATASELLAELEAEYGLPVDESIDGDTRRATLAAKVRARFEGTPDAITSSAQVILTTASVVEISARDVAATDPDAVWLFAVKLGASWDDEALRARILAIAEQQKPAYTDVTWVRGADPFLCDDPDSLTDRDALDI